MYFPLPLSCELQVLVVGVGTQIWPCEVLTVWFGAKPREGAERQGREYVRRMAADIDVVIRRKGVTRKDAITSAIAISASLTHGVVPLSWLDIILEVNDNLITDKSEIADIFNEFYANIASEIGFSDFNLQCLLSYHFIQHFYY